jgi:beta-phosphoglucomutase
MELRGFIFDMDGVVVDNHRFHFKAWMEFAKKHKFELNEVIYRDKYNGKTNADLFQMIFGELTSEQIHYYAMEKETYYQNLYADEMKPHKGLLDFLDYLRGHRYKIALGTSAPPMNVDFTLDRLFLRKYFDTIVDGSQVTQGKPHPQVYQLCAAKLDLAPAKCVVFEDSIAGLESGKRAGCMTVGVATSHSQNELNPYTDKIIFDFTDVRSVLRL